MSVLPPIVIGMTHTIVLPVPSTVRSQFVVLAPDHVPADFRPALHRWASRVRGPRSALDALGDSHLSIALLDSTALGDTKALLRAGNPPHLVHRGLAADPHLLVSCDGSPAQPTAPALTSFGIANVLALEAGGLMFDPLTAEISDPDRELAETEVELTGPPVLSLESWVRFWAHDSRVRTYGMTRFGVPDLSTSDVPTELAEDWTFVLAATGSVLITSVWQTWAANPRSTFLEVHNPLMLCDHHVHAEAFAIDLLTDPNRPHRATPIGLRLDFDTCHACDDSTIELCRPDGFAGAHQQWLRQTAGFLLEGVRR